MKEQILSPAVKDRGEADLGTEMFGIAREGGERTSDRIKEKAEDDPLVPQGQRVEAVRDGEDEMEVRGGEQAFHPLLHPLGLLQALALRTVAIAARVVGDANMSASATTVPMSTQGRRTTRLQMSHDPKLRRRGTTGTAILAPVGSENVGHLEMRSPDLLGHGLAQDVAFWVAQNVQRTANPLEMSRTDGGVPCGHLQMPMSEKGLNHPKVDPRLQHMSGKGVTQQVRRYFLAQPGVLGRTAHRASHGRGTEMTGLAGVSWEQEVFGTILAPVLPQRSQKPLG